ncbi:TetR/AcrR family transcriptional regulator [Baekduia soli]|uniref:TetR/AcrR family transcriptional regulator n=1 Tax=Baekduia soli TaxID=496014 RepID=A0A5B8U3F0_9ACTN|nr:TetR/AcrR family transcriptional regulator [Baekduia soli]QEC47398.1 TetR/AcrR family transcriptional regulator [Baekduia soli]
MADPPKPPRARYEARRNAVVDAAAAVFARKGFHATSVDDLVEATGLQRGGLYYYMKGKQDLLIRIHERFIEPLLENAREIAARHEPPEVELRLLVHALMQDIAEYRDAVTVFLHEWRIIADGPEWKEVRRARREFEDLFAGCIRRGTDSGVFRELDQRTTMRGIVGMVNSTYQWMDVRGARTPAALADAYADIVLYGIVAPRASASAARKKAAGGTGERRVAPRRKAPARRSPG